MILSIGEILADVVMQNDGSMQAYLGGAPFNAAVAAAKAGAKTRFLGRIGDDPMGKFLDREVKKYPLETILQVDPVRPTTLAFVSIDEKGERDFKFLRHDAADAQIEPDPAVFDGVTTVHLGSLMLSEENGRKIADFVKNKARERGAKFSYDVNFRSDIFRDRKTAIDAALPCVFAADIVKFSEEETEILFGKPYADALREEIGNPLAVVTLGKKGCAVKFRDEIFVVPTIAVEPVDTTGAGDAFFGTLLACLDGVDLNALKKEELTAYVLRANEAGARATQHKGALS